MKRKDQAFLDWLSKQRSCLDGAFSERLENGSRRNIPCHVRRAAIAGTGYKPLYSAVPMTFRQHQLQSDQGELACIMQFVRNWKQILEKYEGCLVAKAKAFFDEKAEYYRNEWSKQNG